MKLRSFWAATPVTHELTPDSPRGFTVGSRGVTAIETCADGVVVTLVPGISGMNAGQTEGKKAIKLMVTSAGAGEVFE